MIYARFSCEGLASVSMKYRNKPNKIDGWGNPGNEYAEELRVSV